MKKEALRFVAILGMIVLLGMITNQWFVVTLVLLSVYILMQLRQMYLFERWLNGFSDAKDQKLGGIWQASRDTIQKYQKTGKKRKRRNSRLLRRFNRTLEVLPDAIIVLDGKFKIEWMNAGSSRLLGVTRQDIGKKIYNVVSEPRFQQYLRKQDFELPMESFSPLDASLELEINITPFDQGQYLLTAHDISEVKKVESIRREFLANVSHELRTPLTVISGYLEMLEHEELDPGFKSGVVAASRQANRMQTLVSDLLMLSRIELHGSAQLIEETVNVPQLLSGLEQDALELSVGNVHKLVLDVDPTLGMRGSEKELSSGFGNLVFNAILHTPVGTEVKISWSRHDEKLVFQVEDNGPGIEKHHLARLTERFYRVDKARSRERGGTGLGLAISRHVVQRHGGEIKVDSTVDQGTVFSCLFPVERAVELPLLESADINNDLD